MPGFNIFSAVGAGLEDALKRKQAKEEEQRLYDLLHSRALNLESERRAREVGYNQQDYERNLGRFLKEYGIAEQLKGEKQKQRADLGYKLAGITGDKSYGPRNESFVYGLLPMPSDWDKRRTEAETEYALARAGALKNPPQKAVQRADPLRILSVVGPQLNGLYARLEAMQAEYTPEELETNKKYKALLRNISELELLSRFARNNLMLEYSPGWGSYDVNAPIGGLTDILGSNYGASNALQPESMALKRNVSSVPAQQTTPAQRDTQGQTTMQYLWSLLNQALSSNSQAIQPQAGRPQTPVGIWGRRY